MHRAQNVRRFGGVRDTPKRRKMKMTRSEGRKERVVLADELRERAAYEYRNARRSEKASILKKYSISRGAMSGWLGKGYGLKVPNGKKHAAIERNGRSAQAREHGRFAARHPSMSPRLAVGTQELDRAAVTSGTASHVRKATLEALAAGELDLLAADAILARLETAQRGPSLVAGAVEAPARDRA